MISDQGRWMEEESHERPHLLVTSPESPDGSYHMQAILPPSIGGRIQVQLGFDIASLQLFVTVISATELTTRTNRKPRNPYCKLFLLPERSEKSKRRTRTLAGTTEPIWNQTFVYPGVRQADLRLYSLEITVWDYVRYGANDFLGEAVIELWPFEDHPIWKVLGPHEEIILTPSENLSPPSTGSRYSDSDTLSECDIDGSKEKRGIDGTSVSSVGSSVSPSGETEIDEEHYHNSHRHRKPKNIPAPQPAPSQLPYRMSRSRSKSPRRSVTDHRSLSPPNDRAEYQPSTNNNTRRFISRSATATPTGSPKKRQLPQVPHALARALQERVAQDLEESSGRNRKKYLQSYANRSTSYGWEQRRYNGLSDSDLAMRLRTRRSYSPDREKNPYGLVEIDSDIESVASVSSSIFSTQSERPRGSKSFW